MVHFLAYVIYVYYKMTYETSNIERHAATNMNYYMDFLF